MALLVQVGGGTGFPVGDGACAYPFAGGGERTGDAQARVAAQGPHQGREHGGVAGRFRSASGFGCRGRIAVPRHAAGARVRSARRARTRGRRNVGRPGRWPSTPAGWTMAPTQGAPSVPVPVGDIGDARTRIGHRGAARLRIPGRSRRPVSRGAARPAICAASVLSVSVADGDVLQRADGADDFQKGARRLGVFGDIGVQPRRQCASLPGSQRSTGASPRADRNQMQLPGRGAGAAHCRVPAWVSGSRPNRASMPVRAISGSPMIAVGSSLRMLSISAMPRLSAFALPAVSKGVSACK